MADALVNLFEWCKRERESACRCRGKCCSQAGFASMKMTSPVSEIYPIRTSRDLPTILLSWMAS
jgi:hypothetical protein